MHPFHLSDAVIDALRQSRKFCQYFDVPLQHISDRLLKSMRRLTDGNYIRARIEKIRELIPAAAIRTTFIVGFPGETNKDFKELLQFIEWARFDRMGIFTYSREDGTPAHDFADAVSNASAGKRKEEAMLLQQVISRKLNQGKIGNTFKVLIDGREAGKKNRYLGRTYADAPEIDNLVHIRSAKPLDSDFYRVKIYKSAEYDTYGRLE